MYYLKGGEKMNLEERIAQLEFQVELLFNNTEIDRLFFETKITREQYRAIIQCVVKPLASAMGI